MPDTVLRYTAELDDYVALHRTQWHGLSLVPGLILLAIMFLLVVFAQAEGDIELFGDMLQWIFTGQYPLSTYLSFLAIPALIALVWAMRPWIIRRMMSVFPLIGRPVAVTVSDSGVSGGAEDLNQHVGWTAVRQIIRTPTHIFILTMPRGGMILPRRAVDSETEFDALHRFAIAHAPSAKVSVRA